MPTLVVNTTLDQNDGIADGVISLRDAILEANADPDNDYAIELSGEETYLLTIGAAGEDAGLEGDLDVVNGSNITIRTVGNEPATIDVGGLLTGEAAFHILSEATLELENVIVTQWWSR